MFVCLIASLYDCSYSSYAKIILLLTINMADISMSFKAIGSFDSFMFIRKTFGKI